MAQTVTNQQTAAFNRDLNLNNYSNPFGSQTTSQIGTGSSGAPIYATNTTANPALQNQMNSLMGQAGNSGQINQDSINGLYNVMGGYDSLNNQLQGVSNSLSPQAAQNAQAQGQQAAYASQKQYLDPQFSQQKESLDAQLANQGITPGSEAYNNAMTNYGNQKQQAYSNAANQSILTGSQIGSQNWQNQISGAQTQQGLFGQMGQNRTSQAGLFGQISGLGQLPYSNLQTIAGLVPGYAGPATVTAGTADTAGIMNQAYQNQVANSNARASSTNSLVGALGSALATYGMYALAA